MTATQRVKTQDIDPTDNNAGTEDPSGGLLYCAL